MVTSINWSRWRGSTSNISWDPSESPVMWNEARDGMSFSELSRSVSVRVLASTEDCSKLEKTSGWITLCFLVGSLDAADGAWTADNGGLGRTSWEPYHPQLVVRDDQIEGLVWFDLAEHGVSRGQSWTCVAWAVCPSPSTCVRQTGPIQGPQSILG